MKEPILTREEVQEIERKCDIMFFVPDDSETWPGTYINLQQLRDYTARIESAILEKLCGEPVAVISSGWQICYVGSGPIAPIVERHELKIGDNLYALSRSKA